MYDEDIFNDSVTMKKNSKLKNVAFIDGQNLYMGTALDKGNPWRIDLERFRIFLRDRYKVKTAYYFLGYVQEKNQDLYDSIQEAGFVLVFREHNTAMIGKKKGNVDADIIFTVMKKLYTKDNFEKIILVSGDGDYKMLVDFLIKEDRFEKILFPNTKYASSLYKKIGSEYFDTLENKDTKKKISHKNK